MDAITAPSEVELLKEQVRGWKFQAQCNAERTNAANYKLAKLRRFVGENIYDAVMADVDWDGPEAQGKYEIEPD
jgi:hypothetical protein